MENSPIRSLISEWPSRRTLAEEIGASVDLVHKWAASGRIPARWQAAVIEAAQRRGLDYATGDWMVAAHDERGAA